MGGWTAETNNNKVDKTPDVVNDGKNNTEAIKKNTDKVPEKAFDKSKIAVENKSKEEKADAAKKETADKVSVDATKNAPGSTNSIDNMDNKTDAEINTEIIDNMPIAVIAAKQAFETIMKTVLTKNEQNILEQVYEPKFFNTYIALSKWDKITSNNINVVTTLRNIIITMRMPKIKETYKKLLPPWNYSSTMPQVDFVATGDGGSTNGLNGGENTNRWLFNYKVNKEEWQKNEISSSSRILKFGLANKPMSLAFTWFGENKDTNDPNSGGTMTLKITNNNTIYEIKWTYKNGKLTLIPSNNMPKDIIVNQEKNSVTIPLEYKGATMELTTNSAKYISGGYDEVAFIVASDNVNMSSVASEEGSTTASANALGEYGLENSEKNDISSDIKTFMDKFNHSLVEPVLISITALADDTAYNKTNINKTIQDYQKNIDALLNKLNKNPKLTSILQEMNTNIDNSRVFIKDNPTANEITAQRLLLKNRFLITLDQALQNPRFSKAVETGKVKIIPGIEINPASENKTGKWSRISIPLTSYRKP